MLNLVTRTIARSSRNGSRLYHKGGNPEFKAPSMDELPVPQGSWQEAYDKKQKARNMFLAGAAAFWIFSFTVLNTSGLLYLNWTLPKPPQGSD